MAKEQETAEAEVLEQVPAEATSTEAAEAPETFTRDQIRSAVLDAPDEPEIVDFRGVKIEVRAPALEDLLQYRDAQGDDTIMARAIVNNCYVPRTGEKVFDQADIPALMKAKFSKDMRNLNAAVTRVLGGDEQISQAVDNQTKSD